MSNHIYSRYFSVFAAALLLCSHVSVLAQSRPPPVPSLSATSYILMEASSGRVLAEQLADQRQPPASLTKVMTSYILADYLHNGIFKEDDLAKVSRNAWAQNPTFKGTSKMFIEPAKRVSLLDLYRGMVVSSGNDAAVAVAEHISGTEADFVNLLNNKAKGMGMHNTYFDNSHGLTEAPVSTSTPVDTAGAHTTARDMAILARAVVNDYPEYYKYYAEQSFRYNNILQNNRNNLLTTFEGADGIKTGYTKAAKWCLMSSAKRNDMRLVAVVLGASSRRNRQRDSRVLLEYGFRYYTLYPIAEGGKHIENMRIYGGNIKEFPVGVREDVQTVVPRGAVPQIKTLVSLKDRVRAPIAVGDEVGVIHFSQGSDRLATVPLIALRAVSHGGLIRRTIDGAYLAVTEFFLGDAEE